MSGTLMAGFASSKITPPVGISLTGYASRPGNAAGIHDDIYCKAAAFSNGENTAVLVSLDLLGLNFDQIGRIRKMAAEKTGVPAQNIFIACSHTHAGPATQLLRYCGTPDESYLSPMLHKVADTITDAYTDLKPCRIAVGETTSDLGMNRRYRTPEGSTVIGENEGGVCDPQVKFIYIFKDGKPGAVIYNYACHGVVLGNDNVQVSADWIGAASKYIEENTGCMAMFLQGCCGDINPRVRGGFDAVKAAGELVGSAVVSALPTASSQPTLASLDVVSTTVELPLQPFPSREELERINREQREYIKTARAEGKPEHHLDWTKANEEWARLAMECLDAGMTEKSLPVELSVLRIDGFRILAIPGEVFVDYGLTLKRISPDVIVSGYTNGNIGYVPTAQAYKEGGYEVESAIRIYGLQMIGPESEEIILSAAKDLLERV